MYHSSGELPIHEYVWVDSSFLSHDYEVGEHFQPAIWFGLNSKPGRMWGCHVLLECGAVYRNLPLHALASCSNPKQREWSPQDSQLWDCYGERFSTIAYTSLKGLKAQAKIRSGEYEDGEYLFTAIPIGDSYSAYPEQEKEFKFIRLNNGRYTTRPTNYCIFKDSSFTVDENGKEGFHWPKKIRVSDTVWTCE